MKMNFIKKAGLVACTFAFVALGSAYVSPIADAVDVPQTAATLSGVTVYSNSKASIDASNINEGYISVKYTGGKEVRIKVQVIKEGGATYTYDLNNWGGAEVFNLTQGDGKYQIAVYEQNPSTGKYATAYSTSVTVTLRNELLPFLYPNQYVNYNASSATVAKAAEVVPVGATDVQKIQSVFTFVTNHFSYDYNLAATVQSGYLPVVDNALAAQKGICFDYSSVMSAMLRSQGIPTKLEIGYAGDIYHAWISCYISGTGWVDNVIKFDGINWTLMDPTFVETGGHSQYAYTYTTTASNYVTKYSH